jgi:hypothetical protein
MGQGKDAVRRAGGSGSDQYAHEFSALALTAVTGGSNVTGPRPEEHQVLYDKLNEELIALGVPLGLSYSETAASNPSHLDRSRRFPIVFFRITGTFSDPDTTNLVKLAGGSHDTNITYTAGSGPARAGNDRLPAGGAEQ